MFNLSAAQGPRWARICDEFTERVRGLGPSPVRAGLQGIKPGESDHNRENREKDTG
jgi:hypothetical protein